MSLNIKNERVHQLAREAARVTGKTQTGAMEEALVLLLEKYDADPAEAEVERKLAIIRAAADRAHAAWLALPPDQREDVTDQDLYDAETGLPA